jgi:hypothetical protein
MKYKQQFVIIQRVLQNFLLFLILGKDSRRTRSRTMIRKQKQSQERKMAAKNTAL